MPSNNPLRPSNQAELAEKYKVENLLDAETIEREDLVTPGSARFHAGSSEDIEEFFSLVVRSQRDIQEIIWSLTDSQGDLLVDTMQLQVMRHPMIAQVHSSKQGTAEFLASLVADEQTLGFVFTRGEDSLQIVKGRRDSEADGRVLLTYTNMNVTF